MSTTTRVYRGQNPYDADLDFDRDTLARGVGFFVRVRRTPLNNISDYFGGPINQQLLRIARKTRFYGNDI